VSQREAYIYVYKEWFVFGNLKEISNSRKKGDIIWKYRNKSYEKEDERTWNTFL
jgi:hypothetical protein